MKNEELLDNLKQFIAAQNSQLEERLRSELASKEDIKGVEQRLDGIEAKMATKEDLAGAEGRLMQAIGDAMQEGNEATDKTLKDHERWLRRLDQRAA